MDSLPTELLQTICEYLCLHCREPNNPVVDISNDDQKAARDDQRALALLSRTSRRLRQIAQPILFHFHHCGYIRKPVDSVSGRHFSDNEKLIMASEMAQLHRRIQPFLATIKKRPDLANRVRCATFAMDFTDLCHCVSPYSHMYHPADGYDDNVDDNDDDEEFSASSPAGPPTLPASWFDLQLLSSFPALKSCLFIVWDLDEAVHFGSFYSYAIFPRSCPVLPNLEFLAFCSCPGFSVQGAGGILKSSPNLEVLTITEEGLPTKSDSQWRIPLPRLRRVALSGCRLMQNPGGHLITMLNQATVLEDLEFHLNGSRSYEWLLEMNKCGTVKNTLRRLVYSVSFRQLQRTSLEAERSIYYANGEGDPLSFSKDLAASLSRQLSGKRVIPDPLTARMLPNLEILETEQVILYGPIFQHPEDGYDNETYLVDLLPPKLRILHVGLVLDWEKMRSDLVVLASRAHYIVPDLRIVHLDVYEPRTAAGVGLLREALEEVGITLVGGGTQERLRAARHAGAASWASRGLHGSSRDVPFDSLNEEEADVECKTSLLM